MYSVLINRDAQKYVDSLTEKSRRLVKKKLEMLKDNPHPGRADKNYSNIILFCSFFSE